MQQYGMNTFRLTDTASAVRGAQDLCTDVPAQKNPEHRCYLVCRSISHGELWAENSLTCYKKKRKFCSFMPPYICTYENEKCYTGKEAVSRKLTKNEKY